MATTAKKISSARLPSVALAPPADASPPSPHHPSPRWPATAGRRKARRASSFLPTRQWRAGPWRWTARSARRRPSKVRRRPDPRGSGGAPSSVAGVLQLARWSSPAMCVARAVTMEGCSPHTRRGDAARQSCGPHHFRSAAFFLTQEAKLLPHRDPHALVLLGSILRPLSSFSAVVVVAWLPFC